MACRILRNNDGTVNQVLASNNQPSILYDNIREKMSEEEALLSYAGTYTEPFQKVVDKLKDIDDTTNIYDANGEIQYSIYEYIMHPERFIGLGPAINTNLDLNPTPISGFTIQNNGTFLNISELEKQKIYENYVNLMDRKREGKSITFQKFELMFNNLQVFNYKNTYIFGEWDSANNVFKGRLMSSPGIKELYGALDVLFDNVDFVASVPSDIGSMLERKGLYKLDVGKEYNFRGEEMIKNLYFSSKELVEKIFKTTPEKVTAEQVKKYDTFFNYWQLIGNLKKAYEEKNFNQISSILKEIGIYDYNAYKLVKKLKQGSLTNEDMESVVTTIIKNSANNKVNIDKTDLLNNPEIYNDLNTELNKTLATYLSKFGIKTEVLEDIQDKLGIDSFAHIDILNKIIYVDKTNQENYPQQAGKLIAYMMQHNPLMSEVTSKMKKLSMFNNLSDDELFEAAGDLISQELYNKTDTTLPQDLIESIKNLIRQFFDFLNSIQISRINKNIGFIADNILIQNQSLITQSVYKPGSVGNDVSKISLREALKSDAFGNSVVEKMAKYFILTGSITLSEQGTVYRPDENQVHDLDWVSSLSREESIKLFNELYPDNKYIRNITSDEFQTDTWLIAPEGYKIENLRLDTSKKVFKNGIETGSTNKIIGYDIVDSNGDIVSSYVPLSDSHTGTIEAKLIDIFSYPNATEKQTANKEITLDSGTKLKIADWRNTFYAKLEFGRLKDIWDYNRFIPKDNIFNSSSDVEFFEVSNDTNENIAAEVFNQIANRLSTNLDGVPYNIITQVDAIALLANTQEKYNGQPAFFYNGQVYIIKDKLTLENVFHEFGHPFIKAIRKENPALFNKLFDNLSQTEEGQEIIRTVKEFSKDDENSDDFKEEILVRALTTRAVNNELKRQQSPEFVKFMDKLWYAIKQLMRKVFGKIKIDKLNENTTLDELAKMLNNESFEISTESITDSERAYFNTLKDSVKELMENANDTLVQSNIDKLFKLIGSGKQVIKQGDEKYKGMAESISKEKLAKPFQDESSAISKFQTYTKTNEAPLDLVAYRKSQIEGLVLSLQSYNKSIERINLEINRSKSDPDSIKTISKNFYFLKILQQTLQTFKEIRQDMMDQDISTSSPIFELLNKASNNADNGISAIYKYNEIALPGVLAPHLKGINEVLNKEFGKSIDEMRARGATTEQIAAKERERDSYIRDENTLAKVMIGETPEPAGLGLSTLVESAVSSPDELISSFALYVKEALIDVEINATKNFNDFLADTRKLLEAAGLDDFKMVSKLGKIITYEEELGYTDPKTGEFKTHKVHTFLNKFKGYELVQSRYKYDIDKALESGDLELAAELEAEREEWRRKYMHDKWKPEVYKMYDVFKKTYVNAAGDTVEIGKMAKERYNKIMDDINNGVNLIEDELERIEIQNRMKIDTLWVEYKKLFSKYDNNGNLKTGDELAITETLLEYRAERKKYFEWESDLDPESMPILRFRKARSLFEDQLLTKYDRTDDEFKEKMQEWDDMNTRKVIDKSFYTDKALILEKINNLYNSISGTFEADSKVVAETKKYWDFIIDQLYAYRDEENHPNGILVSKEKIAEIKKAQEKIQELQDTIKNGNALSKSERREYNKLSDLEARGIELTEEDADKLRKLAAKSYSSSLPKVIKDQLKELYNELANLQSKKATDYYHEVYNHQIDLHNERIAVRGLSPIKHFDRFDIDDLALDRGFVENMFKKDPEFKKWFMANHIEVERWDDELRMNVMRFERLYLWNQIEPRDPKYKRMMNFLNNDGQRVWIWGMPSLAYYKQNIKPEFATEEIVGETVDNRGNPLPRLDVPNSPFINQEYFDLKRDNEGAFNLLEKIKEYHLKFQEKAPENDRLWMQVPRYEKTSKELTETNKFLSDKTSTAKTAINNFLNKFRINAEDTDEGLGIEDKFKLTRLDFFDNDEQKIHISGKTLMNSDQVSLDVITSVLRHMHSVERAHKLAEIEPMAKALMEVLNDPKNAPKDITKASWYHWITQKVPVFANKKGENIRAKAIKGLIDRTFYNVQQTGFGSDAIVLQKLSKVMMQAASFGFFALDIPSGVKNRFGQQLQQAIELASGTSYDAKSFLKGKMIASKAMLQISGSIYSKGKLPYYVQLVNAFDPSQGMAMDKLPEYITRTIYKDIASPTNILMSPRKFMEIEATLEFFFGVMEFTKVEQTINGVTTEIPYHEAFELVDDRLTLKEGIDEKWDLGGSEFKRKRIFIQEKQNILNGVYSKFDQPEGNRYLFYRMFMFLRKFFITGMVNRFGFSGSIFAPRFRRNNASQTLEMGYWIQTARALAKLLVTVGKHWHYMRPSEKGAVFKALTEVALLTILSALIPMLFGWDGDDDDKYEKLRKRQGGPLGSDDFQMGGWLANHLLYQTMSVASENMQYYKVGFYSDMLSNFNLANGPSLQTYGKILGDVIGMVSQDDSAYYSKDVGPYPWQKAESAKILNHVGKAFALTGKTLDPSKAIQDFISAENIYK